MKAAAWSIAILMLGAVPAMAEGARVISSKESFADLVNGRTLAALGVRLQVLGDGSISGRAFGKDVSGRWEWQGGFFCRDLMFGETALPANCQQVLSDGSRITFVADKGSGQRADLKLR